MLKYVGADFYFQGKLLDGPFKIRHISAKNTIFVAEVRRISTNNAAYFARNIHIWQKYGVFRQKYGVFPWKYGIFLQKYGVFLQKYELWLQL